MQAITEPVFLLYPVISIQIRQIVLIHGRHKTISQGGTEEMADLFKRADSKRKIPSERIGDIRGKIPHPAAWRIVPQPLGRAIAIGLNVVVRLPKPSRNQPLKHIAERQGSSQPWEKINPVGAIPFITPVIDIVGIPDKSDRKRDASERSTTAELHSGKRLHGSGC